MKFSKKIFFVILLIVSLVLPFIPNNNVYAATGVDYVLSTWNNYPKINSLNFDGGWDVSGDILYTSNNIHWTGFWNAKERNNGTHKSTTLKVHVEGSACDDYNINLTN